jgi:hypothetical protein
MPPGSGRNSDSTVIMIPGGCSIIVEPARGDHGSPGSGEHLEPGPSRNFGEVVWRPHRPIAGRPWFRRFGPNLSNHAGPAHSTGPADTLILPAFHGLAQTRFSGEVWLARPPTVPSSAPLPKPPDDSNKTDDGNASNAADCTGQTPLTAGASPRRQDGVSKKPREPVSR